VRLFQAWGVLEERAGNIALARQLYKCAVKADGTSQVSWLTWSSMAGTYTRPLSAQPEPFPKQKRTLHTP
jgi:hypothetical protein